MPVVIPPSRQGQGKVRSRPVSVHDGSKPLYRNDQVLPLEGWVEIWQKKKNKERPQRSKAKNMRETSENDK